MSSCICGRRFSNSDALRQHQRTKRHCFCHHCDRFFRTDEALKQHHFSVHNFPCPGCSKLFTQRTSAEMHQRSKGHCYCKECDRFFQTEEGLEQHHRMIHSTPCPGCSRKFTQLESLQTHQRSTGHCYCSPCDRFFVHPEALGQHLRSPVHATQFHCCDCDRDFVDEHALNQHLANKIHSHRAISDHECEECGRGFRNKKALQQHRSSVVHNPLSNLKCVDDSRCKKRFSCPSALLHHLESGSCSSGMTRQKLNSIVRSQDTDRVITSGSNLLTEETSIIEPDLSSTTGSIIMFTPDSSIDDITLSPSIVDPYSSGQFTPQSDSSTYELLDLSIVLERVCPLCPPGRKRFSSPRALRDHLSSPAHAQKLYHCPLALLSSAGWATGTPSTMKYFSTLSGLTQHIESGACEGGGVTFQKAIKLVEKKLQQLGFRQSHLLS